MRTNDATDEECIISLLYSLTRQIIDFIPPNIVAPQLRFTRFSSLDDALRTWKEGLNVLSDFLIIAPPPLLIIIDGLERLDFAEFGKHYLL